MLPLSFISFIGTLFSWFKRWVFIPMYLFLKLNGAPPMCFWPHILILHAFFFVPKGELNYYPHITDLGWENRGWKIVASLGPTREYVAKVRLELETGLKLGLMLCLNYGVCSSDFRTALVIRVPGAGLTLNQLDQLGPLA